MLPLIAGEEVERTDSFCNSHKRNLQSYRNVRQELDLQQGREDQACDDNGAGPKV